MQTISDIQEFIHPELGREVTAIGGHYVYGKEVRMPHEGREILYFVGYAVLDSTCCGVGGCAYALVPGFIRTWKYKKNQNGCLVSEMNPIRDQVIQKAIQRLIQKKEMVSQVTFV